jgi:CoA:oxalate CoA-transferase
MTTAAPPRGPYSGLRVLDFTMFVSGPYCTRLMADMGAEVIKVEPTGGDFLRSSPPSRDGHSAYFGTMNAGKKSLALDLKQPKARSAMHALIATSDVLIENFRPGVMARLELDKDTAFKLKPDLIYCSVSGFGQDGPSANRASYAPIVHAASGFDMLIPRYDADVLRPAANRYVVADALSATHALAGIGAALFQRSITGHGEYLDVALMDTMHNLMAYEYADAQFPARQGPIVFKPMQTRDGFVAIAPVSQANFAALARAANHPEWMQDERFAARDARVENWATLLDIIAAWAITTTSAEAEAALVEAGCPAAAYRTIEQARLDPQVVHRGAAVTVSDPAGEYQIPNCPIKFQFGDVNAGGAIPAIGEHNNELLREAGLNDAEIAALRNAGAVT